MTKATYNNNVGIDYFYELFKKAKISFPKSYFFGLKTRKKNVAVDVSLYRNLVKAYLDNYFVDFYNAKGAYYFPLSGKLEKSKGHSFFRKKSMNTVTDVINWIWHQRPALNYSTNMKIIKLRGNTNIGPLEKAYKTDNDVALLKDTTTLLRELDVNNKLYL